MKPSPEADRATLIRRVSLDLTGLPPSVAEVDAFEKDDRPDAYERLVDRLLASPHYGEHRARYWLDYARYGDTHGLHLDNYREMWPYRDWVIRAINADLPFDHFARLQLAGDVLLPGDPKGVAAKEIVARLDAGVTMEVTNDRAEGGKLIAERPILQDSSISDVEYRSGIEVRRLNGPAAGRTRCSSGTRRWATGPGTTTWRSTAGPGPTPSPSGPSVPGSSRSGAA